MLEKPIYKDWFKLDRSRITEAFYTFKIIPPEGPDFWPRSEGYRVLLTLRSDRQYLDSSLSRLHEIVDSYARAKGIDRWTVSIRIPLRGKKVARMMVVPKELVNNTKECTDFLNMLTMGKATATECSIGMLQYMFYWKALRIRGDEIRKAVELADRTGKIAVLTAGEGASVRIRNAGSSSWFFEWNFNGYLGWEGKAKPKIVILRSGDLFMTYSDKRPLWYPTLNLLSLILAEFSG